MIVVRGLCNENLALMAEGELVSKGKERSKTAVIEISVDAQGRDRQTGICDTFSQEGSGINGALNEHQ